MRPHMPAHKPTRMGAAVPQNWQNWQGASAWTEQALQRASSRRSACCPQEFGEDVSAAVSAGAAKASSAIFGGISSLKLTASYMANAVTIKRADPREAEGARPFPLPCCVPILGGSRALLMVAGSFTHCCVNACALSPLACLLTWGGSA